MATFNFNKPIISAEGHPMIDRGAVYYLPKPTQMEVMGPNGKPKSIEAIAALEKEPPLTYAKSIRNTLRQAGNDEKSDFDKDECGTLLFKLVADTEVELNVDERKLILDASKKFADTESNYRIKELIDSEGNEDGKQDSDVKKKGKK